MFRKALEKISDAMFFVHGLMQHKLDFIKSVSVRHSLSVQLMDATYLLKRSVGNSGGLFCLMLGCNKQYNHAGSWWLLPKCG